MRLKVQAYYWIIGLLFLNNIIASAQDQKIADSLLVIYKENKLSGSEKLELLKNLSFNTLSDPDAKLNYSDELIKLAQQQNNQEYLYSGYLQKGNQYLQSGEIPEALKAFFKCVEIAKLSENIADEGTAYMSIADSYAAIDNHSNAINYYNESIKILRKTNDSIALASALLNAGDTYYYTDDYNNALTYFEESGEIFKNFDYKVGIAFNLGNVGMVYAEQGKDALALENINEAISILEDLENYYPISVYLTYMADIYAKNDDFITAFNYAERSLELAKAYQLKNQISDANLKLSELHERQGDGISALNHYKNFIVYRDSIKNLETIETMADQRTDFEVAQKQIEVDLLNQEKKNQNLILIAALLAIVSIGIMAIGLFRRNRFVNKTNKIIAHEKERSDKLLLNILPKETAQELKDKGSVAAKKFDLVTVFFSDFRNFSLHAEHLSPEDLVKSVDFYFSRFDQIIQKYGLEKIKTIGDAYMCAGGLPYPTTDHASKMIMAALDIQAFVESASENNPENKTRFELRIGINSGPVVAGVVGSNKFAYDIWGDTVNIASRMESHSDPGMINISEDTYVLVKDHFNCSYRGEIEVKNKGKMKMYFVHGLLDSVEEKLDTSVKERS